MEELFLLFHFSCIMIFVIKNKEGAFIMSGFFRRHLITKLIVGGAFAALTFGSAIAVTTVNKEVIIPNEGFITEYVEKNFTKTETTV